MRLQKAHILEVKTAFMDCMVVRAHQHAAGTRKKVGPGFRTFQRRLRDKALVACRQLRTIVGREFIGRAGERSQVCTYACN